MKKIKFFGIFNMPNARPRNLCFTWNNYTEADVTLLQDWITDNCKYGIFGREVGESGTPHLQGYFELRRRPSFSTIKAAFPSVHFEPRRGTAQQASDYCRKEDDSAWEHGQLSSPGRRSDLLALVEDARDLSISNAELFERHPVPMLKYRKHVMNMRIDLRRATTGFEPVEVLVFWGAAGTGKTRRAFEIDPNLYMLSYGSGHSQIWFDGYEGQDTILFDDFYGGAIKYGFLLKLLDGYKFDVPIKGGFTRKLWKRVIITSNANPRDWYPDGLSPALRRRIKEIVHFDSLESN